jgi:hypothetical protein
VCRLPLYSAAYERRGEHIAGIWMDRTNVPAAVLSLLIKRHKCVFLSHYNIFIPPNASSDMHFHAVHAVSHP